jgi:long-chain fatty acid transport protein
MKMIKKNAQGVGVALVLIAAQTTFATNGDTLEGIGAVSEALGGTGVAAPQDSLTAVVNNPAGLSFTPSPTKRELTIGTTLFQPVVKAKIGTPGGTLSGGSDDPLSAIPFLGYSQLLNDQWAFGVGAYGVAGMGVDYRGKHWDLDGNPANGYEGDLFSQYSSLKVSPALSYKASDNLSIGGSIQGNYSTLDLGQGKSDDVSAGLEIGTVYKIGQVQLGASYTTPQKSTFKDVYNFDAFAGDTKQDSLTLEQPAIYAGGIAWQANKKLLVEFDTKYLTWGDSEGYGDFDWGNQLVYALGTQYKATDKLTLRAGYNFAKNPVNEHTGWNPQGLSTVQGKQVPTFGYEMLRNVGFPAIVQSHLTLGFGYQLTESLTLNAAYAHAFEETVKSASVGNAINLESTLAEDSLGLSLALAF